MPRRKKTAKDYDWDRIEHMQNPPASGKDKGARGGNNRVRNAGRYEEKFSKIKWYCRECGAEKPRGERCPECEGE